MSSEVLVVIGKRSVKSIIVVAMHYSIYIRSQRQCSSLGVRCHQAATQEFQSSFLVKVLLCMQVSSECAGPPLQPVSVPCNAPAPMSPPMHALDQVVALPHVFCYCQLVCHSLLLFLFTFILFTARAKYCQIVKGSFLLVTDSQFTFLHLTYTCKNRIIPGSSTPVSSTLPLK